MRKIQTTRSIVLGAAIAAGACIQLPASSEGAGSGTRPICHGKRATVLGTDGEDSPHGKAIRSGDVVALGDGDDFILLQRVDRVTICGGQGDDTLYAGEHAGRRLVLDGEEGQDDVGSAFYGGSPKVARYSLRLFGGPAGDSLTGSASEDLIDGGNAHDLISANAADDRVLGGAGDDDLAGERGADDLLGGRGDDNLFGGHYLFPGPASDRGDRADGQAGRDYCLAPRKSSCERRSEIP